MIIIRELKPNLIDQNLKEMLDEIPKVDEFLQTNDYNGKSIDEIKSMVEQSINKKVDNDDEDVPQKTFVIYEDTLPIGLGGVRLTMTPFWLKHGGHLWYKIRPTKRKLGYATKLTDFLVYYLSSQGIHTIYAQCNIDNIGSQKVLTNNHFVRYDNPLCTDWADTLFYKKEV